ncbi:MAG: hypothetical protein JWM10_462 [Myxococcaceae bacterium]|nr:hypothetical protein [Myxococcaceae bacterium]
MRLRLAAPLTLLALAPSCRRAVAPTPEPSSPSPRSPVATRPPAVEDEQPLPEGYCHPATVIALGRGGAVLEACFDPQSNRTDLVGQRVDADAMTVGSRTRLLRIPGNVLSLSAVVAEGSLRVAWVSQVGEGAERSDEFNDRGGGVRVLAVAAFTPALAPVGVPVEVNRYAVAPRRDSEARGWTRSRVELAAGPEASVLALATDGDEPCAGSARSCATWSVFSVAADGSSRRVRHESSASPSAEPQGLVRVGDDLAYVRGADVGRSTLFVHSLSAGSGRVSSTPAAMFDALPDWFSGSLAWTGTALVALGEERPLDAAEARSVVRVTPTDGPSPTRPRATDEGDVVRWPLVTERSWRCVRRHPVLRVAWHGGAVELDPTAPGASIDLSRWLPPAVAGIPARAGVARWYPPMAWTGRALLALDGHDHLRRWTCGRDGDPPTE